MQLESVIYRINMLYIVTKSTSRSSMQLIRNPLKKVKCTVNGIFSIKWRTFTTINIHGLIFNLLPPHTHTHTASLEIIELGQFFILAARDSPWYKIKQSLHQAFWFLLADFPLGEERWRGRRDLCSLSS